MTPVISVNDLNLWYGPTQALHHVTMEVRPNSKMCIRDSLQAVHEGGIVHAVGLDSGGDTGDPQLTEVPLLQSAADVSVGQGLHDLLVGHLEAVSYTHLDVYKRQGL